VAKPGSYLARACLLTASLSALVTLQSQTVKARQPFPVFDATLFAHKPDLARFGLRHITVIYAGSLWNSSQLSNHTTLPDRNLIGPLVRTANQSGEILVVDIEQWPLVGDSATITQSLSKYATVIQWFKQPIPSMKVGLYGAPPIRDYWDSVRGEDSPQYARWQKENDRLASIARVADALFPSIYTFYEDRNGWQTYAIAQIREARRYGGEKPVYVFLWPQYHPSNKKLANTFLPGDYWRLQLETARKYADGIVIWCCPDRQAWNANAAWWLETQEFLKGMDSGRE
jgi:hypothetical protein